MYVFLPVHNYRVIQPPGNICEASESSFLFAIKKQKTSIITEKKNIQNDTRKRQCHFPDRQLVKLKMRKKNVCSLRELWEKQKMWLAANSAR